MPQKMPSHYATFPGQRLGNAMPGAIGFLASPPSRKDMSPTRAQTLLVRERCE